MADNYLGEIRLYTNRRTIVGWMPCDGRLLPISQYDALFTLIGNIYGGDGVTTFALPDLRGRALVGTGQGNGLTNRPMAQSAGTETVTLLANQMPAHTHPAMASSVAGTANSPNSGVWAVGGTTNLYHDATGSPALEAMAPTALQPAGGSQPHDNMQPYLTLNYFIAVQGLYPSFNN